MWFHRFDVLWTPTVLIYDDAGKERHRIEGYLPREEFRAQLEMGLARVDFMRKKFADAEQRYQRITSEFGQTTSVAEAIYWAGVCRYKLTNDHTVLPNIPEELKGHEDTIWAKKASVWEKKQDEKVA